MASAESAPSADDVVVRLLARPATLDSARLLTIDGPAGSGKSTLARQAGAALTERGQQATVIGLDDLYDGWAGLNDELVDRVLAQVLGPLARTGRARWQRYDWERGAFEAWQELALPDVLVLEGCGAGARRFAPYTTLLVWAEAAPEVRTRRMVARDGDGVRKHLAAWTAAERAMFAANATSARADLQIFT